MLACGTAVDIFVHKLRKTWPPELGGNELASLQVTRVTGSLVVMAMGKDGATEGSLWGDIDVTLVGQDAVSEPPVREARPERGRDVFQGCLQVLEDEGI